MTSGKSDGPQPDEEFRAAMRDIIATRWVAVRDAIPAALADKDPEGVHEVRVASRRLRAAMDVAVDCFPVRWYHPLHRNAKLLTSALGGVRDRDVTLAALAAWRERATDEERPGIDDLIQRVARERTRARKEMIAFLSDLERQGVPRQMRRRFPVGAKAAKRRGKKRAS